MVCTVLLNLCVVVHLPSLTGNFPILAKVFVPSAATCIQISYKSSIHMCKFSLLPVMPTPSDRAVNAHLRTKHCRTICYALPDTH